MLIRFSGADLDRRPDIAGAMFAVRHAVFVRRRGWRALDRGAEIERDEHDGPAADYILCFGSGGRLAGGLRLLPLQGKPTLAAAITGFDPSHAGMGGKNHLELTRFFAVKGVGPPGKVRDELLSGLFAHCRELAVTRLLSTMDAGLLTHFRRLGAQVREVLPPRCYDEGVLTVVVIEVEPSGPEATFLPPAEWPATISV